MPEEVIAKCNLRENVTGDGFIYVGIYKGVHGLPQANLLAQELLEERLNNEGYKQSIIIPGLWTHTHGGPSNTR